MDKTYNYGDYLQEIRTHADKTALINSLSGDKLSYAELVDLSYRVCAQLKKANLKSGDRLMLLGLPGLDWVPIFFGAQLAGVITVPIDARASKDLLTKMIESTSPALIIKGRGFHLKAAGTNSDELIKKAQAMKKTPDVKAVPAASAGQILLTSGTWSKPKGVTLRQSNVLSNMLAAEEIYKLHSHETLLSLLPLAHAYEQMCGLHLPLRAGCTIVYLEGIEAEKIKAAIKRYKVSLIVAVPRILELFKAGILRQVPKQKRPLMLRLNSLMRFKPVWVRRLFFKKVHAGLGPSLRTLVVGGAPLASETDKFFQGLGYKILIGYGLSETAPIISIMTKQYRRRVGEVGRVLSNLETEVNKGGELLVRGPSVFAGYWPKMRKADEWFNTGDLVKLQKGTLFLNGRRKDMFTFASGDKVIAADIEGLVDTIANVEESIALGEYEGDQTAIGLRIIYKAAAKVNEELIRQTLANYLPRSVTILELRNIHPETLVRTHTLKLARQSNREKYCQS